jgi:hypothetical protein
MTGVLGPITALVLAFVGLALLALTQPGHRKAVYGRKHPPVAAASRRAMRLGGGVLVGLAVAAVLTTNGPAFGVPLAALLLGIAAYAVMAALTWTPGLFRPGHKPCETISSTSHRAGPRQPCAGGIGTDRRR